MVLPDLHRLRLLVELEHRGTLAAVATALNYSPSSVSQQLNLLEKEIGEALLAKSGRGVRLTDAGRLLVDHARELLIAAEAATVDVATMAHTVRGTVRAGALQSATRRLLIPALVEVSTDHPDIRVEIEEIELEQGLPEVRLGTIDVIISDEYLGHPRPRPAGLTFQPILEERVRLVLPAEHPLAADGKAVDLGQLRHDVWVSSDEGTGHHAMVIAACRDRGGFEPDLRHRSNDADVQLELIRRTGAVGLLPHLSLPPDDAGIAIRDIEGWSPHRQLLTVTRTGPTSPALTAYLTALRRVASRIR